MQVYLVKRDRFTEYDKDFEITVYDTYIRAYKLFKRFIREELKSETFWRRRLKWKNGVPWSHEVCFEFFRRRSDTDETECYWRIAYKGASGFHTFISIEIKEVLQK